MESSATEEQQREGPRFNSPCTFFEQVIKACLDCFGLHDDHSQHPPPLRTEREMKFNEETIMMMATRSRKATKPPISSGPGGQINFSSSVSSS
ncbi:unnamed protein product [Prunus armeniaca]|uniref:Uncharacterized protein n=1 Tax=Prunus armeniaca TaxID=36596 RepID=A0A6J5V5Y2_PRUAR|nr:unnamed protein product [Prunus armeniaca]CAB4313958.1 unnamed protein product [Prunus armeniaca]